jgi:hypothetical protein
MVLLLEYASKLRWQVAVIREQEQCAQSRQPQFEEAVVETAAWK